MSDLQPDPQEDVGEQDPAPSRSSADEPRSSPRVTVVIPVRNERHSLPTCLRSVLQQTLSDLQVLVVDGRSTDGTREVVRAFQEHDARVELLDNPAGIVPSGLNIALAAARAPWLVRVDGHATIPPDYVATAVRLLEGDEWGGVGGVKRAVGRTVAGRAVAVAMSSPFGVGGSLYHYGTVAREVDHVPFGCYRTELARRLGGWDEQFVVNQDFEFDHRLRRAGHRLLFDPRLVIEWECRQSIGALFRQYCRYGRGKAKVALRHPDSVRPRHLVPPALVSGILVTCAAGAVRGPRALGLLAPYVVGLAVAGTGTARGALRARERALVPVALAAMHVGWGLGFWRGLPDAVRARRTSPGPEVMPCRAGAAAHGTTGLSALPSRPAPPRPVPGS